MSDEVIGGPCKTCGSLTSMLIAARTERNKLREAISDAGFSVMQTSGRWSIHDVSKFAEAEQAKTDEIIGQNIDLEIKVKKLESQKQPTAEQMFHLLWTACVGKDGYSKTAWHKIERQLRSANVIE